MHQDNFLMSIIQRLGYIKIKNWGRVAKTGGRKERDESKDFVPTALDQMINRFLPTFDAYDISYLSR